MVVPRVSLVVLFTLVIGACAPTNQAARYGDAAAARGDWKAAESAYRAAVNEDPTNTDLGRRYQDAKARAIDVALGTANACRAQGDEACAERELAYVLELDPTNVAAAAQRQAALAALARQGAADAGAHVAAGRPLEAFRSIEEARKRGADDALMAELATHERAAAALALTQAQAQLAGTRDRPVDATTVAQLDLAASLVAAASQHGADGTALAAEVSARRRDVVGAVTQEAVRTAEAAMTQRDFNAAAATYERAAELSGDATLRRRAIYARGLADGDAAVRRRDFVAAATALRVAASSGEDQSGMASQWLAQVEPRPYRVRLDGLMLSPTRPGTDQPWVGPSWMQRAFFEGGGTAVGFIAGSALKGAGAKRGAELGHEVGKTLGNIPPENLPVLRVWFELPDGRRYATSSQKGLLVQPGAEFVVRSNALDTRQVVVHVQKVDGTDEVVAQFRVSLGELVAGHVREDLGRLAPALVGVAFWTQPADEELVGGVVNLEAQDGHENLARRRSAPARGRVRYRLTRLTTTLTKDDIGDDFAGPPDPFVRVFQDRINVFESKTASDTRTATWALATTELFVAPNEILEVRVIDADPVESDTAFSGTVTGAMLEMGRVQVTGRGGSTLVLEAVRVNEVPQ